MQYLFSRKIDLTLIYAPQITLWLSFIFIPDFILYGDLPIAVWLVFVLGIDVAHVWSSLFRTYVNKQDFENHKKFLVISPIIIFLVSFLVSFYSVSLFWTLLAYIAVFHFIKQQYGFLALYRNKAKLLNFSRVKGLDKVMIYSATGIPVLLWHLNPNTNLAWFVKGDFLNLKIDATIYLGVVVILSTLFFAYYLFWLVFNYRNKSLKWGSFLWVTMTVVNWFGAIVYLNSDFIFTTTNVLAHGIPYFILITYYKHKTEKLGKKNNFLKWLMIIVFSVLLLAFIEEYFWDTLLFEDRPQLFGESWGFDTNQNNVLRAFFFAILSLPQIWHYFVDGIIWKANDKNPSLKKIFKSE